ncbi:hypothetical protein M513_03164 [Trichuris suis]|uniref:Uncharacterized protein n=1 Tax=Trichuris suis TaxID=68888 RepID=A0A085MFP4_9BILA|nr:hypothetical protein M513_03164 [Trichuris suis]
MINVDELTRMCKRFCKAVMENSEIAAKYEWSRKADNESFFEMLRSAERLDEERKTNSVNHRITFRRYAHRPTHRGYKRETAFAVALIALYGMGVGYFIAGLWTFAIGFVVAATQLKYCSTAYYSSFLNLVPQRRSSNFQIKSSHWSGDEAWTIDWVVGSDRTLIPRWDRRKSQHFECFDFRFYDLHRSGMLATEVSNFERLEYEFSVSSILKPSSSKQKD